MQYTVLLVYIVLLLVGGLIGYFKGKSAVSLVMSAIFAAALIVCAVPGVLPETFSQNVANVLMAALLVVFGIRWAKTKKFMPAGLMLILTVVALALRNISF